jgi:hypothetical protein
VTRSTSSSDSFEKKNAGIGAFLDDTTLRGIFVFPARRRICFGAEPVGALRLLRASGLEAVALREVIDGMALGT